MRPWIQIQGILISLLILTAQLAWSAQNNEFSVEVFPAMASANTRQDAIVYQFRGNRVTSQWQRTVDLGDGRTMHTQARLKGRYENGALDCTQTAETRIIGPKGFLGPDFKGGDLAKFIQITQIRGSADKHQVIQAKAETRTTRSETLVRQAVTDSNGKTTGHTYTWFPLDPSATLAQTMAFTVCLPRDNWYASAHIQASGQESREVRRVLERIDKYWDTAADTLAAGNLALARSQIATLTQEIQSLDQNLAKEGGNCAITFTGLATDDKVMKISNLTFMTKKLRQAWDICNERQKQLQDDIAGQKQILSANVLKGMIRNFVSWSNSIPTDLVSGLAGYSNITGFADLPRSFVSLVEDAAKDASVLTNQFRRLRALSDLKGFYEDKRQKIADEKKKIHQELKRLDPDAIRTMDSQVQAFFRRLSRCQWQENPERQHQDRVLERAGA